MAIDAGSDHLVDEGSSELEAWRVLIASEGWRRFQAVAADEWGAEATLRKIDEALARVPRGDQAAIDDTVQQIQVARREVQRLLGIPAARVKQLSPERKSMRPFDTLRRIGR